MSEQIIVNWGYFGLFVVTFISSSLAPLTSQPLLFAMERLGYNVWGILLVATLGNYCGSLTTYYIGRYGGSKLLEKYVKPSPKRMSQAETLFAKWGVPILFFSWVPLVGDALVFVSGIFKVRLWAWTLWVGSGKWLHFAVGMGIFQWVVAYWQ